MLRNLFSHTHSIEVYEYVISQQILPRILWATPFSVPDPKLVERWDRMIDNKLLAHFGCPPHRGGASKDTHYDSIFRLAARHQGMDIPLISDCLTQMIARNKEVWLNASSLELNKAARNDHSLVNLKTVPTQHQPAHHTTSHAKKTEAFLAPLQCCSLKENATELPTTDQALQHIRAFVAQQDAAAAATHYKLKTAPDTEDTFGSPSTLEGHDLVQPWAHPPNKHPKIPALAHGQTEESSPIFCFWTDGSAKNTDKDKKPLKNPSAGYALIMGVGPAWWQGNIIIDLLYDPKGENKPAPFYKAPAARKRVAVRAGQLTGSSIKHWPSHLPETWPLVLALTTTPLTSRIIYHTDCDAVIKKWNAMVLQEPRPQVALAIPLTTPLHGTCGGRWRHSAQPYACPRNRIAAGPTTGVHHYERHRRLCGKGSKKGTANKPGQPHTILRSKIYIYPQQHPTPCSSGQRDPPSPRRCPRGPDKEGTQAPGTPHQTGG